MADRARGAVSFTPIVTIDPDDDADAVDAIHHNIKGALGGDCTFTVQDSADKWFYAPNVIVTSSGGNLLFGSTDDVSDLVGASGDQVNGPNEAVGSPMTFTDNTLADCSADKIWFLFIKNTGTSDTSGTLTTNSIRFTKDGFAAQAQGDAIEVPAGEAWMGRLNGTLMQYFNMISGQVRDGGAAATVNGSDSVRCTVVAIIEDVDA